MEIVVDKQKSAEELVPHKTREGLQVGDLQTWG